MPHSCFPCTLNMQWHRCTSRIACDSHVRLLGRGIVEQRVTGRQCVRLLGAVGVAHALLQQPSVARKMLSSRRCLVTLLRQSVLCPVCVYVVCQQLQVFGCIAFCFVPLWPPCSLEIRAAKLRYRQPLSGRVAYMYTILPVFAGDDGGGGGGVCVFVLIVDCAWPFDELERPSLEMQMLTGSSGRQRGGVGTVAASRVHSGRQGEQPSVSQPSLKHRQHSLHR